MATQVLVDGKRAAAVKQIGAGTIDVSTLEGAPAQVTIQEVMYDIPVGVTDATLSWDATAGVLITTLTGQGKLCFERFGGLINNAGAGKTGDIVVAGTGNFMVLLVLQK